MDSQNTQPKLGLLKEQSNLKTNESVVASTDKTEEVLKSDKLKVDEKLLKLSTTIISGKQSIKNLNSGKQEIFSKPVAGTTNTSVESKILLAKQKRKEFFKQQSIHKKEQNLKNMKHKLDLKKSIINFPVNRSAIESQELLESRFNIIAFKQALNIPFKPLPLHLPLFLPLPFLLSKSKPKVKSKPVNQNQDGFEVQDFKLLYKELLRITQQKQKVQLKAGIKLKKNMI